jgi:hypothetical protein
LTLIEIDDVRDEYQHPIATLRSNNLSFIAHILLVSRRQP